MSIMSLVAGVLSHAAAFAPAQSEPAIPATVTAAAPLEITRGAARTDSKPRVDGDWSTLAILATSRRGGRLSLLGSSLTAGHVLTNVVMALGFRPRPGWPTFFVGAGVSSAAPGFAGRRGGAVVLVGLSWTIPGLWEIRRFVHGVRTRPAAE